MNIWRSVFRRLRDDRGQSLVIVALAFVVLCGMVGLTFDIGNGYMQKQNLQAAADAGALAAAQDLLVSQPGNNGNGSVSIPDSCTDTSTNAYVNGSDACTSAIDVAHKNDHRGSYQVKISDDSAGNPMVQVQARSKVQTYFAAIIGIPFINVATTAEAKLGPTGGMSGLSPIGIPASPKPTAGQSVTLVDASGQSLLGNYGFLNFNGVQPTSTSTGEPASSQYPKINPNDKANGGADALSWYLENPKLQDLPIYIGYQIPVKSGRNEGPAILTAIEDQWNAGNRIMYVPVVDVNGNTTTVTGFAAVKLDGPPSKNNGEVKGTVLHMIAGDPGSTTSPNQDYGTEAPILTK